MDCREHDRRADGDVARVRRSEGDTCQWTVVSGQGFFTNTANLTTEFRPSWSGEGTVQVV